jgi:endonuclease I
MLEDGQPLEQLINLKTEINRIHEQINDEDQQSGLEKLQTELHTLLAAGNEVNSQRENTHVQNDVVTALEPLAKVNSQTTKFDELINVPPC